MSKALWVSRSTIAVTRTLSAIISLHLLKARFVVMMIDFFPALRDRWLKSSSPASCRRRRIRTHRISQGRSDEPVFKRAECAFLPGLFYLRYKPWHGGEHDGHALSAGFDTQSSGNVRLACSGIAVQD